MIHAADLVGLHETSARRLEHWLKAPGVVPDSYPVRVSVPNVGDSLVTRRRGRGRSRGSRGLRKQVWAELPMRF